MKTERPDQLSVELFAKEVERHKSTPMEKLGYIMETTTEDNPYAFAENHADDMQDSFYESLDQSEGKDWVSSAKDMYYREVRKIPLLTKEQEMTLARESRLGDEKARAKLTEANLRLVGYVANYYRHASVDYEDLLGEGNIGLIHAVERFDERKECRFCTYAVWYIRKEIVRYLAAQARVMAIPEKGLFDINTIQKAIDKYTENKKGQMPTIGELAKITGVSKERIMCLIRASTTPLSIDLPFSKQEQKDYETPLSEIIPDSNAQDPFATLEKKELFQTVVKAMSILSRKERRVMELRFGLLDGRTRTLEEIGREFHWTRERVRQIEAKAKTKIKNSDLKQPLFEFYRAET